MSFRARLMAFEKRCQAHMPNFKCSVHLCLGQEAVPEQIHLHLRKQDWLFSTHRSHGHYLAKGGSEGRLFDELLGKDTGINKGFSGSQSFCDVELRFHSTAIVGGLIGAATGAALANKLQGKSDYVVCCIGDGATEQGVFWEALNFAALHSLRICFVCEDNGLSVHAPIRARQSRPLSIRVKAFGLSYFSGADSFGDALDDLPSLLHVHCDRKCAHVSAMEDLRE